MTSRRRLSLRSMAVALLLLSEVLVGAPSASAQVSLGQAPPTLTERFAGSTVVVRCRLEGKAPFQTVTQGTFSVVDVIKGKEELIPPEAPGQPVRIKLQCADDAAIGSQFLYANWAGPDHEWESAVPVSSGTLAYLARLPKPSQSRLARCTALYGDLESVDLLVADDVVREFSRLKYPELRTTRALMPHAKLVAAIDDAAVPPHRRSEYLRMLSVCGTKDDLPVIRKWLERIDPLAVEVRRVAIAAYITIGGESALAWVEDRFLKYGKKNEMDVRNTIDALRLVEMNTSAFPDARLLASYRLVLDYPPHTQFVVDDLVRLKDWATLPRLVQMSRDADDEVRSGTLQPHLAGMTRGPLVKFLIDCPLPEAKARLEELKLADPKFVKGITLAVFAERANGCPPPEPEPGEPLYPWWIPRNRIPSFP